MDCYDHQNGLPNASPLKIITPTSPLKRALLIQVQNRSSCTIETQTLDEDFEICAENSAKSDEKAEEIIENHEVDHTDNCSHTSEDSLEVESNFRDLQEELTISTLLGKSVEHRTVETSTESEFVFKTEIISESKENPREIIREYRASKVVQTLDVNSLPEEDTEVDVGTESKSVDTSDLNTTEDQDIVVENGFYDESIESKFSYLDSYYVDLGKGDSAEDDLGTNSVGTSTEELYQEFYKETQRLAAEKYIGDLILQNPFLERIPEVDEEISENTNEENSEKNSTDPDTSEKSASDPEGDHSISVEEFEMIEKVCAELDAKLDEEIVEQVESVPEVDIELNKSETGSESQIVVETRNVDCELVLNENISQVLEDNSGVKHEIEIQNECEVQDLNSIQNEGEIQKEIEETIPQTDNIETENESNSPNEGDVQKEVEEIIPQTDNIETKTGSNAQNQSDVQNETEVTFPLTDNIETETGSYAQNQSDIRSETEITVHQSDTEIENGTTAQYESDIQNENKIETTEMNSTKRNHTNHNGMTNGEDSIENEVFEDLSDTRSEDLTPKIGEMNGNMSESTSDSVSTISEVSSEDSLGTKPKIVKSGLPVPCSKLPVKSSTPTLTRKFQQVVEQAYNVKNNENGVPKKKHDFKSAAKEIQHYCNNSNNPKNGGGSRRNSGSFESTPEPLRKRSSSVVDMRTAGSRENRDVIPVRENAAMRKRISALRQEPEAEPDYMTPLQRKDAVIAELRAQLRDAQRVSDDRAASIEAEMEGQRLVYEQKIVEKDDLITKLDDTLRDLEERHQTTVAERVELSCQLEQLTKDHEDLKEEMIRREKMHQQMYLDMYKKGQDSARFERRDELDALARSGTENVSVAELLEKLKVTEQELEWWQSARRDELYKETQLPETTADATLRFLRDSMYHYLMKGPDADQHMQAIISIFKYTDTQLKNIKKAEKKNRKKSS